MRPSALETKLNLNCFQSDEISNSLRENIISEEDYPLNQN